MQTLTPPSGRIYMAIGLKIQAVLELTALNNRAKFQLSNFVP